MKILIVGDLHGRKPRIHYKDFDCIIQIGDVCDDRKIGPFWRKFFKKLKKARDLDEAEKLNFMDFVDEEIGKYKFEEYKKESLERGREIMEYLNSFGKPVFFIPGNWDQSYGKTQVKDLDKSVYHHIKAHFDMFSGEKSNKKLVEGLENVIDCQMDTVDFNGVNIIGYGLVSGPELFSHKKKLKKRLSESQVEKLQKANDRLISKVNNLFKKRDKKKPTIFLSHNVPYGTNLDVVKQKGSYAEGKHLGSSVARKMCLKFNPLLCIGCHVHEGEGTDKLGKTKVVNTGFGRDAQILLDLDEKKGKIKKLEFWRS
ncbi:MAG: metallophosphoesterase [Candidatus Pacearchaeota archaeon]